MKCRITYSLTGTAYGVTADSTGFAFQRGDIVDLPVADVADLIQRGCAELRLTGEVGRPLRPSAEDVAEVAAALAADQPVPSPLASLRDRVTKGARNAG